jgi:L,D-peptidoglycan transpeptidase YkuD (ErfK/YbiS/YcfS/YnhG family)
MRQVRGRDALHVRDERRRRGWDRNHTAVSVAALLAAGALACPAFSGTNGSQQLVTVQAARGSTSAALETWQRRGACWRRVGGPWTARLGRNGLSGSKREGDGTTPTGTFPLGPTVYGIAPNPGVRGRYHRLVCGDWWDEDPASPTYNTFRHLPCGVAPRFGGQSEALWRISPQYRYFAVIGYNAGPVVPSRGSAIFLHVAVGSTAGCVSLPEGRLVRLLRWLRPSSRPLIRIGIS